MEKIKVLTLTHSFPTNQWIGRGIFTKDQVRALDTYCKNTVVFPKPKLPYIPSAWLEPSRERLLNYVPPREKHSGIELLRPEFFYIPRIRVIRSLQFRRLLTKELKSNQYDILHAHWVTPDGYAASTLSSTFDIPTIITVHAGDIYREINHKTKRWMIKKALEEATMIISVANYFSKYFNELDIPENKIRYIPNGVDTTVFKPMSTDKCKHKLGLPIEETNYLYIGRLAKGKGLKILIQAFSEFVAKHNDTILTIVGSGPLSQQVRKSVEEKGLTKFVNFFPWQPHEKVAMFLNASDFFVLPTRAEGNPVTVLEALCCGTPVLGTNIKALEDLITPGKQGLLFDGNTKSLIKVMQKAMNRQWDAESIASYGKKAFGWKTVARRIYSAYKEAIDRCQ